MSQVSDRKQKVGPKHGHKVGEGSGVGMEVEFRHTECTRRELTGPKPLCQFHVVPTGRLHTTLLLDPSSPSRVSRETSRH